MITHLKTLSLPYTIYGPGNTENVFKWGIEYYSKTGESLNYPKEFAIFFPKSPVLISRCVTNCY